MAGFELVSETTAMSNFFQFTQDNLKIKSDRKIKIASSSTIRVVIIKSYRKDFEI